MVIRPSVYIGIGDFGIEAIGEWMAFLHTRLPHVLPYVRACGLCGPEGESSPRRIPCGRIVHGQLDLTAEAWIQQIRAASDLDGFARRIRHGVDALPLVEKPEAWPVQVHVSVPRVVLVASSADPLFRETCFPEVDPRGLDLGKAITEHVAPGIGLNDLVALLFIDQPEDAPFGPSLQGIARALACWEGKGIGYLVSRRGWHRNETGDALQRSLWQAVAGWDEEYGKGARCFARHALLLLLRAGEPPGASSVWDCIQPHENPAPHFYALGFGVVLEPAYEVEQYRRARRLRFDLLGKLRDGPVEVPPNRPSGVARGKLPGGFEALLDPTADPHDVEFLERLITALTIVPRPEGFRFEPPESPALADLRSLKLETLTLSDVRWWTGRRLPVETRELLRRIQKHCLDCLQAAMHWRDFLARAFRQAGDAVKAGYDASLRATLAMQEESVAALVTSRLGAGGLSKSQVLLLLKNLLERLEFREGMVAMVPPKIDAIVDEQFARRVRQMVFELRVQEQISTRSSLAYATLSSAVLGVGLAYAVYGACHSLPRALLYSGVSFLAGPVVGALLHLKGQRNRVARERALQTGLLDSGQSLVTRVEAEMRGLAEAYCKAYERLYQLRAERALRRLLTRTAGRLRVAEQLVEDRCREMDQRLQLLGQLPELKAAWVHCTAGQQEYEDALRQGASANSGLTPLQARMPLAVPGEPFEEEPFQSCLGRQMMDFAGAGLQASSQGPPDRVLGRFDAAFQECQKGAAYPSEPEELAADTFALIPQSAEGLPAWRERIQRAGLTGRAFPWTLDEMVLFARVWRVNPIPS
ncbi:MAG TPA: hypothetical protein PKJ98_11355 [Verrucomicrobiota bacterium]|nr:hypothetical protein [Verrucomicrobiota bacterium]